jgi:predicted negative regulator of RcsB-dependent stress response
VEVYNPEQEQVEALKAWWDKNGRSALFALVVFLLAVLGWQQWQKQQQQQAEAASDQYQQMLVLMAQDAGKAMEAGRALVAKQPGSAYAVMASMAMAKLAVEQNELDGAAAHLRMAMEQSSQPELARLARLRLARVEFSQGKAEAALATLGAGEGDAAADELRGDILLSQGKHDGARAAYSRAVASYGDVPDKRELAQMKLDDLAQGSAE